MRKVNKIILGFLNSIGTIGCVIAMFSFSNSFAQEGEGEIKQVEIVLEKNKQIVLPQAERNYEKVPPRAAEPIKPEITYQFKDVSFKAAEFNPSLRPLRLKDPSLSKIYGNYVAAGFGNYASPYGEAYITSKRDKTKFFGAKFFHRSFLNGPVDSGNSGSGNTELRLFGKAIGEAVTAQGFLQFENQAGHFYGYKPGTDVPSSAIRQSYNIISVGAEIENTKASDFNFNLRGGFSSLSDNYSATEQEASLNFASDIKIDKQSSIILNADYYLISRKDALINPPSRHIFKVKPAYRFVPIENLTLTAGANIVVESDTIGNQKGLHLYPNVTGSYKLSATTELFAAVTGDVDKVSLHSLSRENIWLNSNIGVFNTNRTFEFAGGIKTKIAGKVSAGAGISLATLKNLYYYVSDTGNRAKFNTVFDNGSTQRANFYAEVGYGTEIFKLLLRGDLYAYSSGIASQAAKTYLLNTPADLGNGALHRPTYKFALNTSYNIYDKILLNADLHAMGGIKALDFETKMVTGLPAAVDLNFKVNYFVSKQFSAFVLFNNMLSGSYQLYLNYPVRGFQGMIGASWSF